MNNVQLTFDNLKQHNFNTEQLNQGPNKKTTYYANIAEYDNQSTIASSDSYVTNVPIPGK